MRDYTGLNPQFRPGGTKDPKWMEGARRLLPSAKSVDPDYMHDMFAYYDGLKLKIATLVELADAWDAESVSAEPAARRETLRECADMLRMIADSSLGLLA